MNLRGHLLYIDITQICGIGCTFCMYADKHKAPLNMTLSSQAKENLSSLINSPDVKRIAISGEGEPLNNISTFYEILGLSSGGKTFEFITSGFLPHDRLIAFYEKTNALVMSNGDTCNIRLSADHYHIEKIRYKPHGISINYLRNNRPQGLTFSFRSLDTDRTFTQVYLTKELLKWGCSASIDSLNALEDTLTVEEDVFNVDYKNLVKPPHNTPINSLNLAGYIRAIEEKIGKRFTLGSLNKSPQVNGVDLTIKPDGDVFFYGIENKCLGNVHSDHIRWENLVRHVDETPLLRTLYTQPFSDLINVLSDDKRALSLIQRINNPYWLIKEMAHYDGCWR